MLVWSDLFFSMESLISFKEINIVHEQSMLKRPRKLKLPSCDRCGLYESIWCWAEIILKWNTFIAYIIEKAGTRMLNWWILLPFSRTSNSSSFFLLWKNARPNLFTVIVVALEGINTLRSHHSSQRNCNQKCISFYSQDIWIKRWDNGALYGGTRYFCNKKDGCC